MDTVQGVKMSPRMERLWRFIREERKIALTDWSTDECVERVLGQLQEGEKVLVTRAAAEPGNRDLANLLVDYRSIMARRPQARVDGAAGSKSGAVGEDAIGATIGNAIGWKGY